MKTIKLTQDEVAFVDDDDYGKVRKFNWFYKMSAYCGYAARSVRANGKVRTLRLHSFIIDCPAGMEVHHKNEDHLDNRRENLEVVTKSQNVKAKWIS